MVLCSDVVDCSVVDIEAVVVVGSAVDVEAVVVVGSVVDVSFVVVSVGGAVFVN